MRALGQLIAAAAFAVAAPAPADTTFYAPDGRTARVVDSSLSVSGGRNSMVVRVDVALESSGGADLGTSTMEVYGCSGHPPRLVTTTGRPSIVWAPGGDRLFDLLAEAACNAAIAPR